MKQLGSKFQLCPYYQSKIGIDQAQLICVPYVSLIDKATREGIGIDVQNSVIIFDEAHNILDATSQIFSKEIKLGSCRLVHRQIADYAEHYKNRLKQKSYQLLQNLLLILQSIINLV